MKDNVRLCNTCHEKLFAIIREKRFYCRKCGVYVVALNSETGDRIGPGNNPVMIGPNRIIKQSINKKIIYKLKERPKQ